MHDTLYMQTFWGFMAGGGKSNYGLLFREKARGKIEWHFNVKNISKTSQAILREKRS